jgi:hypothetical protein
VRACRLECVDEFRLCFGGNGLPEDCAKNIRGWRRESEVDEQFQGRRAGATGGARDPCDGLREFLLEFRPVVTERAAETVAHELESGEDQLWPRFAVWEFLHSVADSLGVVHWPVRVVVPLRPVSHSVLADLAGLAQSIALQANARYHRSRGVAG